MELRPVEPTPRTLLDTEAMPSPPLPPKEKPATGLVDGGADEDEDENDEADADEEPRGAGDPYANLDGAFGNYLADQPRPMGGRHDDDDDLLS